MWLGREKPTRDEFGANATEDLMFSLPRELRADLKKAGVETAHPKRGNRRSLTVNPV